MDTNINPRVNAPIEPSHAHLAEDTSTDRETTQHERPNLEILATGLNSDPGADAPTAFVFRPARNPMQSAHRARKWVLQLEPTRPLGLEPLMGWTSGDDPSRHICLPFPTREAAIAFGKAQGWRVYTLPENERKPVLKSYRDKFAFTKPRSADTLPLTPFEGKAGPVAVRDGRSRSRGKAEVQESRRADPLDEALQLTYPASDPLPLWSGRIGPPAPVRGATA